MKSNGLNFGVVVCKRTKHLDSARLAFLRNACLHQPLVLKRCRLRLRWSIHVFRALPPPLKRKQAYNSTLITAKSKSASCVRVTLLIKM